MEQSSTIKVTETRRYEVPADRADLHVTIEGTSLVTGDQALHKAREVAQLVHALTEYGLPADAVFLQGVYADKFTGVLGKASQARYRLRVRCADLTTLGDLLGIVTAQKSATLNSIEWGYPYGDTQRDEWLVECVARANAKAARIAEALGVRVLGVHAFSEEYADEETRRLGGSRRARDDEGAFMRRSMNLAGKDLGMEVSHVQDVEVSVEVEYLVSAREAQGSFSSR